MSHNPVDFIFLCLISANEWNSPVEVTLRSCILFFFPLYSLFLLDCKLWFLWSWWQKASVLHKCSLLLFASLWKTEVVSYFLFFWFSWGKYIRYDRKLLYCLATEQRYHINCPSMCLHRCITVPEFNKQT